MELEQTIEKLDIKPDDILVLRGEWDYSSINQLARDKIVKNHLVIILRPGQEIETLDEDVMKEHGWVKA